MLPLWRESHKTNIFCRNAIESAIRQSFDGMHLNPDCLKPVLDEYGYKRTAWVLANTLHELNYDGRFSRSNKLWANRIFIPNDPCHNICARTEKGAAVAAASYLNEQYPDMAGFSPRNVRRMRDFYRLYGDVPELLTKVLRLSWTQNIVIMEAELSAEVRAWYIDEALRCDLTKAELLELLASAAHLQICRFVKQIGQ